MIKEKNSNSSCAIRSLQIEEIDHLDPASPLGIEWEALVGKNPQAGFMQSLHWARFKESCEQTAIHLVIRSDKRLIAGCFLYTCPDEKRPTVLIAPYGPVLPWHDQDLASRCLRLILEKASEIAKRVNAVSLRIEPRIHFPAPSLLHEFAVAPVNLVPAETLLLDLTQDLNVLLSQMKAKCRYNISLSARKGVEVRDLAAQESKSEPSSIIYDLLEEASDRDDFYLEPDSFFKNLIEHLLPSGLLRVFIAEHESDPLGCLLMITHGDKATYLYGGIANQKRNLMAGYALQWHAIKEAKLAGCTAYDFYGYDQFQSPHHPYARFSRFKSGFGGSAVRFIGAQDYMFMDRLVDNVIHFFKDLQ